MRQRLNILDLGLVTCLLPYCCTCVDHLVFWSPSYTKQADPLIILLNNTPLMILLSPGFENPYILRPSPSKKVIFCANVISTRFCTGANMWWWWCRNPKYPQWEVFPRPCLLFFLLDKERPHHQPTVTTYASHFYLWRIFFENFGGSYSSRCKENGRWDRGHCCLIILVG